VKTANLCMLMIVYYCGTQYTISFLRSSVRMMCTGGYFNCQTTATIQKCCFLWISLGWFNSHTKCKIFKKK